jgi:hypothetical protein
MAFQSKNGKSYGSKFVARRHDAAHSEPENQTQSTGAPKMTSVPKEESRTNPQGEAKFSAKEATAPDNNVENNPEGVDASQVASEHGPAVSVSTHHDHKNNKHKVISHHPDGHVHVSDHQSQQDAHNAAGKLGGTDSQNAGAPEGDQTGDGDMFGQDGFSTPKLA